MQRSSIARMQSRLMVALQNEEIAKRVKVDFNITFRSLGLNEFFAKELASEIQCLLLDTDDLEKTEAEILRRFKRITSRGRNLVEILDEKLSGRAEIIFNQVGHFFQGINDPVLDFGCGDGQVTQLLQTRLNLDIIGYDVRDYRAKGVTVPIRLFDGAHVGRPTAHFAAGLITNVLHHEMTNQNILDELTRLICKGGRLVVIETVPLKDDPAEFEVTFLNDWLYNRTFRDADIPVPGTYETTEGWIRRFGELGWEMEEVRNLGYDQPTIRDLHVLLVMKKK